ncbi:MAG: glutathione S-transferase family protein [Pseudomonadales bacterium]|jgi:glutathione S-transferase|nr:glutathione S-transferase family protein [Pseudomonadales bacterium]
MQLHDSFGMNPRMVRFFLLEKGLELPRTEVDILAAENRQPAYLAVNPAGQTPALTLDDGRTLAETWAICEYLEELHPQPVLIGDTPEARAETRMWWRRAEQQVCHPMVQGFYYAEGLDLFRTRFRCLPEAADGLKARARDGMGWLDGLLADRRWLAGERFTVADICLYCYVDQLSTAGQPMPEATANLRAWFERVDARPAAAASVWHEQPLGMRG